MVPPASDRSPFLSPNLWFAVLLGAVCLWVLSLPYFPTQDGPMHRYYVHVLASLLHHDPAYAIYRIRHPFPPYATQYGILMGLFHVLRYDLAEKLFTCLVLVTLAVGLRLTAQEISPAGRWISLLFAPLLLGWPLMRGSYNYVFGLGLLLLCTAFWQRLKRGSRPACAAFLLFLLILTFTHPIPLLLLIALCGLDLLLSLAFRPRSLLLGGFLRQERLQLVAFCFTVAAFAFPAFAIDSSQTGHTLAQLGFHPQFVRTALLLTGISPYNSRSLDVSIDLYRLFLYAMLAGTLWVGGVAAFHALRQRRVNFGTTLFVSAVLLTLALPMIPNEVNGSWDFATRLVFVLWPAALLGACAHRALTTRQKQLFIVAGITGCVLTLLPAQRFLAPVAQRLSLAERMAVPHGVAGALLLRADHKEYTRYHEQLGYDPYVWGGMLSIVRADDVALDTPWMDQKITPLEPAPGSPATIRDIAHTGIGDVPADAPAVKGRSLAAVDEARIVKASSFLIMTGTPGGLAAGLSTQLSPAEQAKFHCERPSPRYLLCTSAPEETARNE